MAGYMTADAGSFSVIAVLLEKIIARATNAELVILEAAMYN